MAWCSIHYVEQTWDSYPNHLDVWVNLTDLALGREGLTPVDDFDPKLEGRDITGQISATERRELFECLRGLRLGYVEEPAMGCDGSDHDLSIAFSPTCSIRCRWWTELPAEWQGVEPILRILRKGAGMASEIHG